MPRGNDSDTALADLRGQYGGVSGNAEDLIRSVALTSSPELETAQKLPRNVEATNEIRGDLEKYAAKADTDGEVIDAAVRGPYVVFTVESETGRKFKVAALASDVGYDLPKSVEKVYAVPEDVSAEGEAERAAMQARMAEVAAAEAAAKEANEAAEEARQKASQQAMKRENKAVEDAEKKAAKAAKDAEKAK